MHMLYMGHTYTTKIKGSAFKSVKCDHCAVEYVYSLRRKGEGVGVSPYFINEKGAKKSAAQTAQNSLNQQLALSHDLVPCPNCGHVPKDIINTLKREQTRQILVAGIGISILLCVGWVFTNNGEFSDALRWVPFIFGGGFALTLLVVIFTRCQNYNRNIQKNLQIARERALLRAEFEKIIHQAQEQSPDS